MSRNCGDRATGKALIDDSNGQGLCLNAALPKVRHGWVLTMPKSTPDESFAPVAGIGPAAESGP